VLTPRRRASARVATWLSIMPGLGQVYNRQFKKAAVFLLGVIGLLYLTLSIPGATDQVIVWWEPRGSMMVVLSLLVKMLSLMLFISTFLLMLTFWYDAMHDARATAQERNGSRQAGGRWWLFHR